MKYDEMQYREKCRYTVDQNSARRAWKMACPPVRQTSNLNGDKIFYVLSTLTSIHLGRPCPIRTQLQAKWESAQDGLARLGLHDGHLGQNDPRASIFEVCTVGDGGYYPCMTTCALGRVIHLSEVGGGTEVQESHKTSNSSPKTTFDRADTIEPAT